MDLLHIRKATEKDLDAILALFESTILHVSAKDYSPAQVTAWAGGVRKRDKWKQKIRKHYFLLAFMEKKLVGFASITNNGYLDFLYVSKDHQRKGIAKALYNELEAYAKFKHLALIETDASITAKPFFKKAGFETLQQQQVLIDDIVLTNFKMKKVVAKDFSGH
jgi:putative acetyltransferase